MSRITLSLNQYPQEALHTDSVTANTTDWQFLPITLSHYDLLLFLTLILFLCFCYCFCFLFLRSLFLYCLVHCFSFCIYSCLPTISAQAYRPLPPGGNPIAVNKYHIISHITNNHITDITRLISRNTRILSETHFKSRILATALL